MRNWLLREELPLFSGQGPRERLQIPGEAREILESTLHHRDFTPAGFYWAEPLLSGGLPRFPWLPSCLFSRI